PGRRIRQVPRRCNTPSGSPTAPSPFLLETVVRLGLASPELGPSSPQDRHGPNIPVPGCALAPLAGRSGSTQGGPGSLPSNVWKGSLVWLSQAHAFVRLGRFRAPDL